MSISSLTRAQPRNLLYYSLRLANEDSEYDFQREALYKKAVLDAQETDMVAVAAAANETRLYFTGDGSSANLTTLQNYIKFKEDHKTSPLLRVLLLAPQSPMFNLQPLVYVEQESSGLASLPEDASVRREAVLTTCSYVFTNKSTPPRWYNTHVEAALCVFQDFITVPATPTPSDAPFWDFLYSTLRYHARDFRCGAANVQLRGILVPTFEAHNKMIYHRDIFADYVEEEGEGRKSRESEETTNVHRKAKKVCVKTQDALDRVIAYLRSHWPRLEGECGRSHLVMNAKWSLKSSAAGDIQQGKQTTPKVDRTLRQSACFVWLQNDQVKDDQDGVYADAALEVLCDELSLAAASIRTPSEAAAVLREEAISAFFEHCRLTHILKRVICRHFEAVVLRQKPLFHWVLSLPAYSQLSTSAAGAAVTAVRFRGHPEFRQALWNAAGMLVHWQQLADSVHILARSAIERHFIRDNRLARKIVSAPPRFPRHRRAIQQSSLYYDSPIGGCVLDHHRGKVNVSQLYGTGERLSAISSRCTTPGETLAASSGFFHSIRSAMWSSLDSISLLEAEETFGSSPKLSRHMITRIPQPQITV